MTYQIFGKKITGPFTIPSGIVATEVPVLEKIAKEIPEIGILTTKSIGLEKREGNNEPIIAQVSPFTFINAVGLRNPGVEEFTKEISQIKIPPFKFLLVSIFGKDEEEFEKVAKKLVKFADGFELNISCPHSTKYGEVVGKEDKLVERIVKRLSPLGKPIFLKISPNLDIENLLKKAIKAGISGITAINTKGPELYLQDGYPVLSNKRGGISGKRIFPIGIECVKKIRKLTSLPIIACGGILTAKELREYEKAGANFFGIGSALAGMTTEEIKLYFKELLQDFKHGTNNAERFLKDNGSRSYKRYKVIQNKFLDKDIFLLRLEGRIEIKPGQFVFLWLPEKGEKPFSVLDDEPLTFLIKIRGYFTKQLSELKRGNVVYLRGPYGNSPQLKGKLLLVGGGTGVAGISLFAKRYKKTIILLAGKEKTFLPYLKEFKKNCEDVFLVTPEKVRDYKKRFLSVLERIIKKFQPHYCLNCGSKEMVESVIEIEKKFLDLKKIYSSTDFLTKCGLGLCGSCATSKGLRSCVDGTFLRPFEL